MGRCGRILEGYCGNYYCQQGVELIEGYAMRDHIHIVDAAEVQGGEYDKIFEREISDKDIQGLSASEAEFHKATFLGKRVLSKHSRIR